LPNIVTKTNGSLQQDLMHSSFVIAVQKIALRHCLFVIQFITTVLLSRILCPSSARPG